MQNLTLLIPTNKESESLPFFLNELKDYECKKLIVLQQEDTDTINSISKFDEIEILVQKNKGYGNALIEGIEKITTEYFCIINADGSMDPTYLNEMLKSCNNCDFVFASRYLRGGGSDDDDIITLFGNKLFSFLGNFLFKLNLSDILYTYILGKTLSAKKLDLKYNDFRICVEIPIKAKFKNFIYISVPSKERKRIAGKKKVNAIKDGFLILTALIFSFLKR
ncbi:glycosyltransferase [Candidatus Pelagibacter sp.]|nr:glycosyltransferase [Candidatus Pelagibacter sp.]